MVHLQLKIILLCCLLGNVVSEYSELRIASPSSLSTKFPNGVYNRPAMFGAPMQIDFHSKTLSGQIAYVPSDDSDGCKAINKTEVLAIHPEGAEDLILMVERGSCDFVVKVQHVQDIGGKAAIIIDNINESTLPFMADDGNGKSITIPSVLIYKKDGDTISQFLKGDPVLVELSWNIPSPDNNVEWELWTTSTDTSDNFKRHFDQVEQVFGNATQFSPRFIMYYRSYCYTPDAKTEDDLKCKTSCTNSGRYCGYGSSGVHPAQSIQENLRQLCLWQQVNGTADEKLWWDYVEEWQDDCLKMKNVTQACSEASLNKTVGAYALIPRVQACVQTHKGAELVGGKNDLLEKEIDDRADRQIVSIPQVLINGMPYFGGLTCPTPPDIRTCKILQVLCMGFNNATNISACNTDTGCKLGQKRDVCNVCGGKGSYDACGWCFQPGDNNINISCTGCDGKPNSGKKKDACGVCDGSGYDACQKCSSNPVNDPNDCYAVETEESGVPTWAVILIVVVCITAVSIGVFFFMQHRQNALRQDIDALMKQYAPLDETVTQNT